MARLRASSRKRLGCWRHWRPADRPPGQQTSLASFYSRLPWPLPIYVEEGEAGGVRLEFRCPGERETRSLRDPEGFELRVTSGAAPTRASGSGWFEGASIFTPRAKEICDLYVSLPGARVEI